MEGREHAIVPQPVARTGAASVAGVLPEGEGRSIVPGHAQEPVLSPVRRDAASRGAPGGIGAAVEHRRIRQRRRRGRARGAAVVLFAVGMGEGGQSRVQLADVPPVGEHRGVEQGEGIAGSEYVLVQAPRWRDGRSDAFGGDIHAQPIDQSRDQS